MPSEVDVHEKFRAALDALVERIRQDRSILAAILSGSLSHDTVWEKSDIDLILVTIDEKLRRVATREANWSRPALPSRSPRAASRIRANF